MQRLVLAPLAKHGPLGVSIALGLALAAQLMASGWQLRSAAQAPSMRAPSAAAMKGTALTRRAADEGVATIVAAHLFGVAESAAEVRVSAAALALSGTIATNDPKRGFAIIGESAQHARLIAPGALIGGGLRLLEVFRDHVTLEREGVLEKVLLPSKSRSQAAVSDAGTMALAQTAEEPAAAVQAEAGSAGLLTRLNAGAEYDGSGRFTGYRLNPSPKIRRDLGLRLGDQLVAVNGTAINAQADLDAILGSGASAAANITVERAGTRLQIALAR